ncbi:MAG: metallophosphoesterase [Nitrospirota bacterium]
MSLFLISFFLVYSCMHAYAFLKARSAFGIRAWTSIFIMVFMLLMVLAPIIVRLSERAGYQTSARIAAYVGYSWLGIIFLFFSVSLAADLYRLLVKICGFALHRDFSHLIISARNSFILAIVISISIAVYGYFEASNIRTERLSIKTSKIPKELDRFRIVQISDVHLGLIVREERLNKILTEVKKAEPDMLVSTGDLVDGDICNMKAPEGLLAEIKPAYGKFAVTGNHEFYAGFEEARCFTENAGFKLLRGETVIMDGIMNIAGVDDPAGKYFGLSGDMAEKELLSSLPRERFTILLKHRPVFDRNALGLFDLQLSGHVHKGQIFPFSLVTKLYYPRHAGLLKLPNHSSLYVSRGSGTWGPPIRFLSPPEVTIIDLVHEEAKYPKE